MAKIRNMGTATMRFNEGVVISGSISTDYASTEGVALVCTGSLEIASNATNDEVIRIMSDGIQREMTFETRTESGGSAAVNARLLVATAGSPRGLRIVNSSIGDGQNFKIYIPAAIDGSGTEWEYRIQASLNDVPTGNNRIHILKGADSDETEANIIDAINGTTNPSIVRYADDDSSNRAQISALADFSITNGVDLTSTTAGSAGNSITFEANTAGLSPAHNISHSFTAGSDATPGTMTNTNIASVHTNTNYDLILSGAGSIELKTGADERVFIMSGSSDAPLSANEGDATDLAFFVSGSAGSKGTETKGTAMFGGDLVISGALHGPGNADFSIKSDGDIRMQLDTDNDTGTDCAVRINTGDETEMFAFHEGGDVYFNNATQFFLKSPMHSPMIIFNHGEYGGVNKFSLGYDHNDEDTFKLSPGLGFDDAKFILDGANNRMLLLSGGAAENPDPLECSDVNFYVSGAMGSWMSPERGTALFGGDLVASGTITETYSLYQLNEDVRRYFAGTAGSKGTSTRGLTLFGGDVHISGSLSVDEVSGVTKTRSVKINSETTSSSNQWLTIAKIHSSDPVSDNQTITAVLLLTITGAETASGFATDASYIIQIKYTADESSPYYKAAGTAIHVDPLNADDIDSFDPTSDIALTVGSALTPRVYIKSKLGFKNCFVTHLGGTDNKSHTWTGKSFEVTTDQSWLASPLNMGTLIYGDWSSKKLSEVTVTGDASVDGSIRLKEMSAPGISSGHGKVYVGTDNKLYYKDENSATYDLTAGGGVWSGDGTYVYPVDGNDQVVIGSNAGSFTGPSIFIKDSKDITRPVPQLQEFTQVLWNNTSDYGENGIAFYTGPSIASSYTPGAAITHRHNSGDGSFGDLQFKTKDGSTDTGDCKTRMVIRPDGAVGIGYRTDTKTTPVDAHGGVEVGTLSIHSHDQDTDDNGAELNFSRYKSGIVDGTNLGEIWFWGSENNLNYYRSAGIVCQSPASWVANDETYGTPSEIDFYVSNKGATDSRIKTLKIQGGMTVSGGGGNGSSFTHVTGSRIGIGVTGSMGPKNLLHIYAYDRFNEWATQIEHNSVFDGSGKSLLKGLKIKAGYQNPTSDGDVQWIGFYDNSNFNWGGIEWGTPVGNDGPVFVRNSDIRLKTNIHSSSFDSLDVLNRIPLHEFQWKRDVAEGRDKKCEIGFIAQEVEKVFPAMVSTSRETVNGFDDFKRVSQESLIPLLLQGIQQLTKKNQELEARIKALEDN